MKPKDEADLNFGRYIRLRDTNVDAPPMYQLRLPHYLRNL